MRTCVLSQDEAERAVEPFRNTLASSILGAVEDWEAVLGESPTRTGGLSNFTFTRFVHDRTVHRLQTAQAAGECPGLRMKKVRGLWAAVIDDQMMLKLKKLDSRLRSRNIQTGQTLAFDNQIPLEGFSPRPLTNATSGYVLGKSTRQIERAVVVCWDGDDQHWAIDLLGNAGSADEVVTLPAAPAPEPTRRRTKIVAKPTAVPSDSDG